MSNPTGFNPANVTTTTGIPQRLATAAVAVTRTSTGTLSGPQGFTYAWAIISNSSPWIMTVTGTDGIRTILPYFADLVVPGTSVSYVMSTPPGNGVTAPNPFVQADWYVSGSPQPPGPFPYPLTSAAISGARGTDTVAVANPSVGVAISYTFTQAARLVSIVGALQTSAAAGTRLIEFVVKNPSAATAWVGAASVGQGPGTTVVYDIFNGAPCQQVTAPITLDYIPLAANLIVDNNWTLVTQQAAFDAGDQWSNILITTSSA